MTSLTAMPAFNIKIDQMLDSSLELCMGKDCYPNLDN